MAPGLCGVVVFVLCAILLPNVSADRSCQAYRDFHNVYHSSQTCYIGFCCGTCNNRYCCQDSFWRLSEDKQEDCYDVSSSLSIAAGISSVVVVLLIFVCCCVCPCCCLYKMCRKPRPVIATTTHTTVITTTPQQYPPSVPHGQPQSYQGPPYPGYQPVAVQPGYGPQPGYGAQPMPQPYGGQPMPTQPFQGQPLTPGPPPTYQEATGPGSPPTAMPYSQAASAPGQPPYPLQPPAQVQPNAPPSQMDYLAQPAYNPEYVAPAPRTG